MKGLCEVLYLSGVPNQGQFSLKEQSLVVKVKQIWHILYDAVNFSSEYVILLFLYELVYKSFVGLAEASDLLHSVGEVVLIPEYDLSASSLLTLFHAHKLDLVLGGVLLGPTFRLLLFLFLLLLLLLLVIERSNHVWIVLREHTEKHEAERFLRLDV